MLHEVLKSKYVVSPNIAAFKGYSPSSLFPLYPQASHWYTIFAAFGEDYNPLQQYTLTDFALFNIFKHRDIIFEICHDAMQEERLRAQVSSDSQVSRYWILSLSNFFK